MLIKLKPICVCLLFCFLAPGLSAQMNPANGLVAYYPLNGDAADHSGNGYNGNVNGPIAASDRFGNADAALELDGMDDNIEILDFRDWSSEISFSFWVKHDHALTSHIVFLEKHGEADIIVKDSKLKLYLAGIGTLESDVLPSRNEWHFIVGTYDGAKMRLYLDGIQVGEADGSGVIGDSSYPLYIASDETEVHHYMKGVIDEVRIYNRSLSAIEIMSQFEECLAQVDQGLVAHYSFNGNDLDVSGNGHHPTYNSATPTDDRFGNPNSAYLFDGIDDYMMLFDPNESLDFSISLWIKNLRGASTDFQWFIGTNDDNSNNPGFIIGHDESFETVFGANHWLASVLDGSNPSIGYDLGEKVINKWYHIAYTYNSISMSNRFYMDGKLVASGIEDMGNSVEPINLGKQGGANVRHANIVADEVRVYNRVLTFGEIQYLYNYTDEPSLLVHLPLDGDGLDATTNGNNGNVIGASPTTDRFGVPGAAYSFDGVDDKITITNPFPMDLHDTVPLSLSCWIRTTTTKPSADIITYFTKCSGVLMMTTLLFP